jgi:hypothetical protein
MPIRHVRHTSRGLTLFCCAGAAWMLAAPSAFATPSQHEKEAEAWKGKGYQEAAACARCHTAPAAADLRSGTLDLCLMTEYAIWKTHDKHAQAYAVLEGPRGQEIGRLLGNVDVTAESTGCLNCHAMGNLKDAKGVGVDKLDGVSCGGCHGPSEQWIGPHADKRWREKSPDEKFKLGMRDLRDPEVKATLCMSCHIGNAAEGKVVTHAMFAAGHPPLPPIEIATFAKNEPQHWRDARDVPFFQDKKTPPEILKNYHINSPDDVAYERSKAVLVGALTSLRETMRLAAERADDKTAGAATAWPELLSGLSKDDAKDEAKVRSLVANRWPEIAMAHSDCYACHHDLAVPGFRQERGFGYPLPGMPLVRVKPGRPVVRTWPLALAPVALGDAKKVGELDGALKNLAKACTARPFGNRTEVQAAARAIVDWSDKAIADVKAGKLDDARALKLIHELIDLVETSSEKGKPTLFDYESARQIASALQVLYSDYSRKKEADPKVEAALTALGDKLDLQPYFERAERGKVILDVVRKAAVVPDTEGVQEFTDYLKNIGDKAALEKLVTNRFLTTLSRGVANDKFTEELKKPDVVKKLQEFSDSEESKLLKTLADYTPAMFIDDIGKLKKLLPK